jgi:hypothetical protein
MSEATDKLSINAVVKIVLCGRCRSIIIVERTGSILGWSARCSACILYSHMDGVVHYDDCKEILSA